MPVIGGVNIRPEALGAGMPTASERPSLGALFKSGAIGAGAALRYGVPYAIEKNLGTADAADDKYYQAWLNYRAQQAQAAAPTGPAGLEDIAPFGIGGGPGKVGLGRAFMENLASSLPYMAATVAGGVAGSVAGPGGALAGATLAGSTQFTGTNVQRAAEDGEFTSEEAARSVAFAPVQAGLDIAIGRFVPGLGKALGVGATREASGNIIKRVAASSVKAAAVEAVTETSQQALERSAAGLPLDNAEAQQELVSAFAIGGLLGGGLGTLGGIRKKPAEMTAEDMGAQIDRVLTGTDLVPYTGQPGAEPAARTPEEPRFTRVNTDPAQLTYDTITPPVQPGQGAPQLTTDVGKVFVDADGVARPGGGTVNNAAEMSVEERLRAMPSGDLLNGIQRLEERAAAEGRDLNDTEKQFLVAVGLELQSREGGPAQIEGLNAFEPRGNTSTMFADPGGRTTDVLAPNPPDPIEELQRPLRDVPGGDLQMAYDRAAETDNVDMITAIEREMAARRKDPTLDPREPFTREKLDRAGKGLRNKFLEGLGETNFDRYDDESLLATVHDQIFVEGDDSPTTTKLAQRLGIVDEKSALTPLGQQVQARQDERAAATPVAEGVSLADTRQVMSFANRPADARKMAIAMMKRDDRKAMETQVLKVLGVSEVTDPAAREQAADEITALAAAGKRPKDAVEVRQEARDKRLEQVALEMGLVKNIATKEEKAKAAAEGRPEPFEPALTAKGRLAAARIPEKTETVLEAATSRGYTGAAAAMFERGATGVPLPPAPKRLTGSLSEQVQSIRDREAMEEAYNAGLNWKVPNTASQQETRDIWYGEEGAKKRGLAAKRKEDKVERGRVEKLSPEQDRQQRFLQALDEFNLPAGRDADKRIIRQMIIDGEPDAVIDEAAARVKAGQTLFEQPESEPVEIEGVRFSAGEKRAIRARRNVNKLEGKKLETRKFLVRESLEAAKNAGDLSTRDFMAAIVRLSAGDIPGAVAFLPGQIQAQYGPDFQPYEGYKEARKLQSELQHGQPRVKGQRGASNIAMSHVLKVMRETAPTTFHRLLAGRISAMVTRLEGQGFQFGFRIVSKGDMVNSTLAKPTVRGTMTPFQDGVMIIAVKGTDFALNGMSYETIMHELLHAITTSVIRRARRRNLSGTRANRAAKDLVALTEAIATHFNNRVREGATLTPLEQAMYDQSTNALSNPDEVLAWGLTNKRVQEYLNSIDYNPRQTFWSRLVELVQELLGMPVRYGSALAELMRISDDLTTLSDTELAEVLVSPGGDILPAEDGSPTTFAQMGGAFSDTVSQLNTATERVFGGKLQNPNASWLLKLMSGHHQARQYGDLIPPLRTIEDIHGERKAIETRLAQLMQILDDRRAEMLAKNPKLGEALNKLMQLTEFELDPTRSWESHEEAQNRDNAAKLKELHRQGGQYYKNLRDAGFADVYDNARLLNETNGYMSLATLMHTLVTTSPQLMQGLPTLTVSPNDRFSTDDALHSDIAAAHAYWKGVVGTQLETAKDFIKTLRGDVVGKSRGEVSKVETVLSPLEEQMRLASSHIKAMESAPYFHMGRFGKYFAAFSIKPDKLGNADPAALEAVAEALEAAGYDDIQISRESTQSRVYIRVDSDLSRQQLDRIIKDLGKRNLLDTDPKNAPKSGLRSSVVNAGRPSSVDSLNHLVAALDSNPMFQIDESATDEEKADIKFRKEQLMATMRSIWLDTLPDLAMAKVMTRRNAVLGQSRDMYRGFAHRMQVSSKAIAGLVTTPKFNEAFTEMRGIANDSLLLDSPNHADTNLIHQVYKEAVNREAKIAQDLDSVHFFDKARAITHGWFLGLSPAYFLLNLTQMGVMLWPQLGAKHGFVEAAQAMAKVTPIAFKILRAQAQESLAKSQQGVRGVWDTAGRVSDVTITMQSLQKAGVSKTDSEFIMNMLARAIIDLGGASRELMQLSEPPTTEAGKALEITLKIGSSFGLYSETFNRLISALAARELHKDGKVKNQSVEDYAAFIVDETMFNYSQTNTASALGRRGLLGQFTPLVTQFMQYSLQATEKLYREFYTAVSKNATADEKAAARRFLGGHMAAVMALAGALGLPFATIIASVIERSVDWLDDDEEPFDASAALRNFLADTFGEEVGEVIARGGPRALGVDISSRAGEQDLLPFSRFIADRRDWKDKIAAQTTAITGPTGSALNDFFEGVGLMYEGEFMKGATKVLPTFMRNPVKAGSMYEKGYTDAQGNKLPMTPTAAAYLSQVIGFTPAAKAEDQERQGDQRARKGIVTRNASILRNKIVQAIINGDADSARDAIRDAQTFDRDNPGFEVLPDIEGAVKRRLRSQAVAQATNTPVGISPKDLAGQTMTRYANIN